MGYMQYRNIIASDISWTSDLNYEWAPESCDHGPLPSNARIPLTPAILRSFSTFPPLLTFCNYRRWLLLFCRYGCNLRFSEERGFRAPAPIPDCGGRESLGRMGEYVHEKV